MKYVRIWLDKNCIGLYKSISEFSLCHKYKRVSYCMVPNNLYYKILLNSDYAGCFEEVSEEKYLAKVRGD